MPGIRFRSIYARAYCQRASLQHEALTILHTPARAFSITPELQYGDKQGQPSHELETVEQSSKPSLPSHDAELQQGAMSRRLAEATEDALFEGGRAGRQAVEDAGFSEELKTKLLEKVQAAKFRSDNASSFAEVGMGSNVGRGTRDIATGQAWAGTENMEDTVLRMLDDARKPLKPHLRGPAKTPLPVVDMRLKPQPKVPTGQRLANARDKSSIYSISKESQMTEKAREDLKRELKERFTPGARPMPNSIGGLAALANERIEDAIARGQFKNIPRGKAIERDARADNPFVDTTEYIMNKMIQRQDIVPPWIEKQQELVKAAHVFRARLRNDWKRHAARTIASRGGSLQERIALADRYAAAEMVYNPWKRPVEQISMPTNIMEDVSMVKMTTPVVQLATDSPATQVSAETMDATSSSNSIQEAVQDQSPSTTPLSPLFRLPAWEAAEMSYLQLAIANLNSLTRSYNLMAPELAKKPYFSLERELNSCYADVAPQLAGSIKERATRPAKDLVEVIGHRPGGVLDRFVGDKVVVYDSKTPMYGFKELWKELWGGKSV